jgi:hypothetical protein
VRKTPIALPFLEYSSSLNALIRYSYIYLRYVTLPLSGYKKRGHFQASDLKQRLDFTLLNVKYSDNCLLPSILREVNLNW